MPKVLRRLGQWAAKLRRMASDIRAQSGIDDVLRGEGIAQDIAEIRKLARGEMENVTRAARFDALAPLPAPRADDPYADARAPGGSLPAHNGGDQHDGLVVLRDREYPRE